MTADWQKKLLTPLNLHLAGLGLFLIFNIFLGVKLGIAWHTAQGKPEDQLAAEKNELKTLNLENAPLRGLDAKIIKAREAIDGFYAKRIPPSDSAFVAELGNLQVKDHVHITRVQYTQAPALPTLVEIRMDASISGDYTEIVHFINDVERDKTFFVIDALALSGQQGGMVNLRMHLRTFLRPSAAVGIPVAGEEGQ